MARKSKEEIDHLKKNISSLEGEMSSLNNELNLDPTNLFPDDNLLPGMSEIDLYDYEAELDDIKIDCDETLECLSSLYLSAEDIEKRNINNIIKNDALALADLKFSLSLSKRGLINLMKQLDQGINDPMMYQSVATFQKEIRDTIKMLYDIQKKMKDFYKDIKAELSILNTGDNIETEEDVVEEDEDTYHLIDFEDLDEQIEKHMEEKKQSKKNK